MKLTKGQFKEITNWHRGVGVIILNTTADLDLRLCPGRVSSIDVYQGRDGKWRTGNDGKSIEDALDSLLEG